MNRAERAIELYNQRYNCGQSIFCAFADIMDIDMDTALKLTQPLGSGLGGLRELCGAVNAMALVIGMLDGNADPETKKYVYDKVKELSEKFRKVNGALTCKELLGLGKYKKPNVRKKPCVEYVRQCAELLEKYLVER
jgi:C_GCAxxG_C_C family probable redox protein